MEMEKMISSTIEKHQKALLDTWASETQKILS